jgi:EAL domain-containing protein (putative c-di-GMP-specific phosphodiesterase class I)/CheY-like chemotaxis protein/nitrogen-specific signal transduction histidine kinase
MSGKPALQSNDSTAIRATDQRLHAQKMEAIGRLAGGVAHEFNNVLTVIQSYACMLEDSLDAGDARRNDVAEIRRAAERGGGITRQLLTLGRHGKANPRSLDLHEVVSGFVPMVRRSLGGSVELVVPPASVPLVVADRGQIEHVLMNLAVNARDAMPQGGRLTIELRALNVEVDGTAPSLVPGCYVEIAVTDTGTGMTAETRQRIFDPFFTTKEAGKGSGLGLAIVHGIVKQAGGDVAVYSELGHGTTFRVRLPVADDRVSAPELDAPPVGRTLPRMTVLVVDDEHELRGVAARVLREAGCDVIEAASSDEARRACVSHDGTIDLALLDVVLADGRGDLLAPQLRELRPALKTLLMSGFPAGALTPAGGVPPDLLVKPFTPSQLRAAVARAADVKDRDAEGEVAPRASARPRVLVVDDDLEMRKVVIRILHRSGLDVIGVDGGRAAIAALEAKPFDVIITDVHMPDGGGLDLLRAVRRIDLDVPMVLMSGSPDVESAAKAVEYGAFRYLTKPLDTEGLPKTIQHAARAHALARLRREAFSMNGVHGGAVDRAGTEVRFEQALAGLWMVYQPIVDAKTGGLFGVEALMRSGEPSLPNPQAVLDAATQLGRLAHVGRRIRTLAAHPVASRDDATALFVNLHPEDLMDIDLIAESAPLTQIASRVVLEVTERASLESSIELSERLARLRRLGFRLAIDDIGAGYSGLTSFTELTPEIVKIDMSLVRDVHTSALKQRTIAALCKLCHEVGCLVVGEGVETVDERECLVALGCDLLQGYLIARPNKELPGATAG